jgi:cell division transport system ATP-binding protein
MLIDMEGVSRSYGRWPALDNISLQVARGEFVVVSGPSGAGKTTLLRLIWMGDLPDRGVVQVAGFRSDKIRRRDFAGLRRRIGVVFQDFRLLPDRTVFHNVALPLVVSGASGRATRKRVFSLLALMGLSHRRNSLPHQLSGGEQQRVAIARAMVAHPLILLADEPTGNLDPDASAKVIQHLIDINRGGTSVVMATHDPRRIPPGSARFLFLEGGKLAGADRWHDLEDQR